jgi:hypothetical protein
MSGKRDEDFDFTDLVLPGSSEVPNQDDSQAAFTISQEDEVTTSYLLVNTLLNLLLQKGIVKQHEVNSLLSELHVEYKKGRRS